ncbi:MAG: nucleotidyltransferase family protein, partial [Oscillospiraceae bacterium]
SASLLRENIQQRSIYELNRFFPDDAFQLFRQEFALKTGGASMYELTTAVLYRLRTMTAEDFAALPDVSEGLEYRLCAEAKNAMSIDDFLRRVKTKRYTMSRLKRIIMYALLQIDRNLIDTPPPYIRVLAFDGKGKEILREAKKTAALPIYHSFAKLEEDFPVMAQKEALATDLFRYACPKIQAGNSEYQDKRPFAICTATHKK